MVRSSDARSSGGDKRCKWPCLDLELDICCLCAGGGACGHKMSRACCMLIQTVAAPAPLVFIADTAAAGKYMLDASLSGFADKTPSLATLTSGTTITTNFTFP